MTRNRIDKKMCDDLIKDVLKTSSSFYDEKHNRNGVRGKTNPDTLSRQNDWKNSRENSSHGDTSNGCRDNKGAPNDRRNDSNSNFEEIICKQSKSSSSNSRSKENWRVNNNHSTSKSLSPRNTNNRKDLLFDKRDFFFPDLPKQVRERMQLDEVAHYSVTDMRTADKISHFITELDGLKTGSIVITDGTACIGGNTISFCKKFKLVQAVELDKTRYDMLEHNLKTLGYKNAKCYNGDYLKYIDCLTQDIVFLDPPWGGPTYREKNEVELFIGDTPLDEVCERLKSKTKYIIIKAPANLNSQRLREKFGENVEIRSEFRKMLLVVVSFYHLGKSKLTEHYDCSKNPQERI